MGLGTLLIVSKCITMVIHVGPSLATCYHSSSAEDLTPTISIGFFGQLAITMHWQAWFDTLMPQAQRI